jgi:hypothetical protein
LSQKLKDRGGLNFLQILLKHMVKSSTWQLDDLQLTKKRGTTNAEHTDNQHRALQDQEVPNPCSVAAQMNEILQGQLGDIPEV